MAQNAQKNKPSNDNHKSISPLQELEFLDLIQDSNVSPTARSLGHWIVRWTNADDAHRFKGHCWAGRDALAIKIDRKSKTTVSDAMRELIEANLVIRKRRPNATSLIRPNWDLLNQIPKIQKTGLPKIQKTGLPEIQKTGPYSADPDSADPDSSLPLSFSVPAKLTGRENSGIPSEQPNVSAYLRDKNGASPLTGYDNQDGVDQSDNRSPIEQLLSIYPEEWTTSEDIEGRKPTSRKEDIRVATVHLNRALRKGIPLDKILAGARLYAEHRSGEDSKYTYTPASWITAEHWDDEYYDDPPHPKAANQNARSRVAI